MLNILVDLPGIPKDNPPEATVSYKVELQYSENANEKNHVVIWGTRKPFYYLFNRENKERIFYETKNLEAFLNPVKRSSGNFTISIPIPVYYKRKIKKGLFYDGVLHLILAKEKANEESKPNFEN